MKKRFNIKSYSLMFFIFCSLLIFNTDAVEKQKTTDKFHHNLSTQKKLTTLELLPPPTAGQLLVDARVSTTNPGPIETITYKFRYRYASTTENGINSQIQLTFPDAYEILSPPQKGGNVANVSNTGNQYTLDLASPSNLGLPAGELAAGASGIFEFHLKFKCGVNGTGDIPAAGSTINLSQNPVFTVSGVSNTSASAPAVTVPTVSSCTVPTNSNTAGFSKYGQSVVGQGMYYFWSLSVPVTTATHTYTDAFPDGFKLYNGLSCCSDFPAGWTVEVQANGTWWDITSLKRIDDFIANVANGAPLKDQNGTDITGTMRVDADVPNAGYLYNDQTVDYAEGVTGIRFTGSGSHPSFYLYFYVPHTTPIGWYQNCLSTTNTAWTQDCHDVYVTDKGSLDFSCWVEDGSEGLGGTTLNSFHGNYLGTNYPDLYKDPLDLQASTQMGHVIKTTAVSGATQEALLPLGFDFVEGTTKPNYWVAVPINLTPANPASAVVPVFTRIPDYNGTGQTLLRWEFPNLVFPAFGPHAINSTAVQVKLFFSYRYMGTHPFTSSNLFTETKLKTGSVMTGVSFYSSDLGLPIQEIECGMNYTIPTNGGSVNSEKYVQGFLDTQQSRFPVTGNTDVSGDATYEMYVYNHNFQKLKEIDIADILPYVGDKDMLGTNSRGSDWSEELANAITVERYKIGSGLVDASSKIPNGVLYANTYNACYLDGALPAGQLTAAPSSANTGQSAGCTDFSGSVSASGAKGFAFQWLNSADPLDFGEYLKITVNVNQLTGEADVTNNEIAWNSFGYTAVEEDDDVLFSSEPLKVGVKMINVANSTSLGGRVWEDANGDGEQNAGEPSFSDIQVSLYNAAGNPVTESITVAGVTSNAPVTTLTDTDGNYMFYGLSANTTYSVRLENTINFDPSGVLNNYTLTFLNQSGVGDDIDSDAAEGTLTGSPVTARPQITTATTGTGTSLIYNDFGFYKLASVGNYVWLDEDAEGDQDGTEAIVQGVTMTLKNGITNATISTDITSEDGLYIFDNLPPGNYYIVASTLPAGKEATGKQITGNSENDSDFSTGSSIETDIFTLESGESRGDLDLGLKDEVINPATICGTTWDDLDEDGIMDVNEPAQERINIDLLDSDGFVLSSTISDANGDYCFNNLTPSTTYQVAFLLPSTTGSSYTNAGTNMEANSSSGLTLIAYTPTANQTINNVDCGFKGPFSIGNLVWADENNNGIRDNGESAYSNIKLYLYNSAGTIILDSTETDAYGKYIFKNLIQGTYKVALSLPNSTKSSTDITNTPNPNNTDNDDNGIGAATSGLIFSNSIVLAFAGGSNTGANWTETDHGELIDGQYDPSSNPKAYYTMDFGLVVTESNCTDGIDNDGDGLIDCLDSDCDCLDADLCYIIADGDFDVYPDTLYTVDPITGAQTVIGSTSLFSVEAMAIDPINKTLYVTSEDTFGIISPLTGGFTFISKVGSVNGAVGTKNINDIDGLTYDVTNNILWGSNRSGTEQDGNDDYIFQLDPATGIPIANAFGAGIGYLIIDTPEDDLDDLAMHPNGTLYAISNAGSTGNQRLITINKTTGAYTTIGDYGLQDVEGLTFTNSSQMMATTGNGGTNRNEIHSIDATNANSAFIASFLTARDVEACACRHSNFISNAIGNFVWADIDSDGIQDLGEPGVENIQVNLLDNAGNPVMDGGSPVTTTTDGNGYYIFSGLDNGSYMIEVILPGGGVTFSPQNALGDDEVDSDVNTSTGRSIAVALNGGVIIDNVDIGLLNVNITIRDCNNVGELFVADGTGNIFRFDAATGALIDNDFIKGLTDPMEMVVGNDDYIYISDEFTNKISRYSLITGALINDFATLGINRPNGMTIGPDGHLYVNNRSGDEVKYYNTSTGAFLGDFVTSGSGGLDGNYGGLEFGPDGNLYVVSANTNQVLRYNGTTGAFIDVFVVAGSGGLNYPQDFTFGPDGNFYLVSKGSERILRYNGTTGAFIDEFVDNTANLLDEPVHLVFGNDGHLYVTDIDIPEEVLQYNGTTGAYMSTFTTGLTTPRGMLFAPVPGCSAICNNSIDNDNDGIGDDCDDDDDNDGILDVDECPTPTNSNLTGPLTTFTAHITTTNASSNAVPHTLDSITYGGTVYRDFIVPDSYTPGFTLTDLTGVSFVKEGAFLFDIGSNANYNTDILPAFQSRNLNAYQDLDRNDFSDGDYFDLKYNSPVISTSGGFIAVTERGGNNPQVVQALDASGAVIGTTVNVSTSDYVDVGVRVDPVGGQNANIALYPIDDLAPVGTEIHGIRLSFGTTSGAASDGPDAKAFLFGNVDLFACDYDGDGIPNHKDLDSDNDGCPDAIEGGGSFTTADLASSRLTGGVGSNGVPIIAGIGQLLGGSQNENVSSCSEVCDNGVDDDGDGLIDCADPDCEPIISNVAVTQPTCTNKTGGQIVITATGTSSLEYSIKNEASWQVSNTFTNLGVGQYTIRVKNDAGCVAEYTSNPAVLDFGTCVEICNDGIDNDGDGLIDCDDPDCANVGTANDINNN
jgi:hypothetical protein